ncbi:uncharacterized protein LOC142357207, partial [Convolutriloba macropyga]|uniref:uncharacterized protein LOC142357207 n=1 Tax=Convolutriloba macropyga TaxID=536237 RepID=UPI003F5201C2
TTNSEEHLYFVWYHGGGLEHFSIQVEPLGKSYNIDPVADPDGWDQYFDEVITPGQKYTVTVKAFSCGAFSLPLQLEQTAKPYPLQNFQMNSIEPGEDFFEVTWTLKGIVADNIEFQLQPSHLPASSLQKHYTYDTDTVFYRKIHYTPGRGFSVKAVSNSNGKQAETAELSGILYLKTPEIDSVDIYEDNYTVLWTGSGYFGTAHMTVNYTAGNEITTDCVIEQEDIVAFECAIIDRTVNPLHHSTYYEVSTVFKSNGKTSAPVVFVDRTRPKKSIASSGQTEGVYDTILNLEYRYGQPMWDYMICRADDISYAGCTPAPDPLGILPGVHCVIEPIDFGYEQHYKVHLDNIPNPSGGGYGMYKENMCYARKFGLDTRTAFKMYVSVRNIHAANRSELCIKSYSEYL